jgi:hypothetical protein
MSQSQRAYLWLYDWTGVYVATIDLLLTTVFTMFMGMSWIMFFVFGARGIFAWIRYCDQSNGRLEKFNAQSRHWQDNHIRWFSNSVIFGFLLWDILTVQLLSLGADVTFMFISYLATVQIRDREPKEFWKMSPQTQGAGS